MSQPGGPARQRGLVGVVFSSTPGASAIGVGDATRLWHKAPCKVAQSDQSWGPPHADAGSGLYAYFIPYGPGGFSRSSPIFNMLTFEGQGQLCDGEDFDVT